MAIDLGSKRIGVAASDPTRMLASPYEVLQRRGSREADHQAIAAIIAELEADRVVVGLPIGLSGREGPAAQLIRSEAGQLEKVLAPTPVELFDERFTTVTANQSMIERNMRADARRRVVDKVAAAVLLQHWLEVNADSPMPS